MKLIPIRKTYTSCDDLPLYNFIRIVVDNDLSQLYSEPAKFIHKQADLAAIWEDIFNEYNQLTNNTQSVHIFHLIKDITVLGSKIDIINQIVNCLMNAKDIADYQPLIDILNEYGCAHIKITNDNKEEALKRCISICKRFAVQQLKLNADYDKLNENNSNKVTTQDFLNSVAVLSKHLGFQIPLHSTTVSLYISYINLLKAANNEANAK